MRSIYLDYNATTPLHPSVVEAMLPFLRDHFGNPSSSHSLGTAAREGVERARSQVAWLIGADVEEIVFTSGGTESNNLALLGVMQDDDRFAGHLVISAIEHPAITTPAKWLERFGCQVSVVPVDAQGHVQVDRVAEAIRPDTKLVSVMHANNEIGSLQPIAEIAKLCHSRGVLLHTDAAQSIGKTWVQIEQLNVDLLTLAGHKLYAPKGVGALYVRQGTPLRPVLQGAGQERGLRPGTENVAQIVGLGKAAELAAQSLDSHQKQMAKHRERLWTGLRSAVGDRLTRNGDPDRSLPNTLSVNFPDVVGVQLLEQACEVFASTGAACHSGRTHRSATLAAIHLPPEIARGTVRLSVGWPTTDEQVDRAVDALASAWEVLRWRSDDPS